MLKNFTTSKALASHIGITTQSINNVTETFAPVSYTHLDVYKSQMTMSVQNDLTLSIFKKSILRYLRRQHRTKSKDMQAYPTIRLTLSTPWPQLYTSEPISPCEYATSTANISSIVFTPPAHFAAYKLCLCLSLYLRHHHRLSYLQIYPLLRFFLSLYLRQTVVSALS